jgi:4-phospho-D-threonate 3-dehydrogenase / 4-phospho-D-erythronate 3-dehydrogenase
MVKNTENILVGISIGDLNGIGSEIILKTFEDSRMLEMCTPVIFANVKMLSFVRKTFESTIQLHGIDSLDEVIHGKINVINIWKEAVPIEFGVVNEQMGEYAIKSFKIATQALKNNEVDVLITAPIHKYAIQSEEFKFPGHTDYLNQELEGEAVMLMVSDRLRIGLLTDHVPIHEVASKITEDLLKQKVLTIKKTLIQDFQIEKPRIAVLGLNPHCGDHGVIGKEDDQIIRPVLSKLFNEGTFVFGPYAADSFFGSKNHQNFDAILAMYHDQGLIPFKTLAFGSGVNYTAGLNKIRTSPDHGTAFEIAGKNSADPNSFTEALYLAIDLYNNRKNYQEVSSNPLKIREKQLETKKS